MLEKRLVAVPAQPFTADGTANGKITVADSTLFKVKQVVSLTGNTLQPLELEVKRITDINTIYVGPLKGNIDAREDVSDYTVALASAIFANEQKRPSIPFEEFTRAVYEEEPTVADRVILVDKLGNRIDSRTDNNGVNRLAVDGQFTAEVDVQVDVDIDGYYDPVTNPDPDNIAVIGHTRSNPTDQTDQVERITAKRGTVDIDTVSEDVSLHDQSGNAYTPLNPVPTTGSYEKFFELIAASRWMNLANYDEVIPTFSNGNNDLTLTYKEDGALLGTAVITNYTSSLSWSMKLNRFIDDDDGTILEDDDGTSLNLD